MDRPLIVAIVSTDIKRIQCAGVPVFVVEDVDEMEEVSITLSSVMDAGSHMIGADLMLLVQR